MNTALFAALALTLLRAQPAAPPLPAAAPAAEDPCAADVRRFCPDLEPGEGPAACMAPHLSKLSRACKASRPGWLAPVQPETPPAPGSREKGGGGRGDCRADSERLCTEKELQSGLRAACLRRRFKDLSPGCAAHHPEWREDPKVAALAKIPWKTLQPRWKAACGRACEAHAASEPAFWSCVERSWDKLGPKCRAFAASHNSWLRKCRGTFEELCPGVPPFKSTECMAGRQPALFDECRAFADAVKKKR